MYTKAVSCSKNVLISRVYYTSCGRDRLTRIWISFFVSDVVSTPPTSTEPAFFLRFPSDRRPITEKFQPNIYSRYIWTSFGKNSMLLLKTCIICMFHCSWLRILRFKFEPCKIVSSCCSENNILMEAFACTCHRNDNRKLKCKLKTITLPKSIYIMQICSGITARDTNCTREHRM